MSKHEELIERVMNVPCYTEEDAKALAAIADALEAQAREIEGLRKDAERWRFAEENITYAEFSDGSYFNVYMWSKDESKAAARAAIDAAKGAPHG